MALTEVQVPDGVYYSKNPIIIKLSSDLVGSADNLKIGIELTYDDGGDFESTHSWELPVDEDGNVTFDLSEALDALLQDEYDTAMEDLPELDSAEIVEKEHTIKAFSIFYYEWFTTDGIPEMGASATVGTDTFVVLGGIKWQDHPSNEYFNDYLNGIFLAGGPIFEVPFLTWQPGNKLLYKPDYDFLFYYNVCEAEELHLHVAAFDLSVEFASEFEIAFESTFLADSFKIYQIPIGYDQLNIDSYLPPDFNVDFYKVWLENEDDQRISEMFTINIASKYFRNPRYIRFMNSLGGWDMFRSTGEGEHNIDYQWSNAVKQLPPDYSTIRPPQIAFDKTNQESFKVNTGYRKKSEVRWLAEMVNATRAYEIFRMEDEPYYLPIIFTSKKLELFKDKNFLQYVQFEYKFAFDNPVHGPVAPWI